MSELLPDEPSIATAGAARSAKLARVGTDPVDERRRAFNRDRKRRASAKAPPAESQHAPANDNLIDRTREVWQPRIGRNPTDEDARQISENVTGFFAILADWSRVEIPTPANDAGVPVTFDKKEVCAMTAEAVAKALGGRKRTAAGWRAAEAQ
jgi:hypothetical protein